MSNHMKINMVIRRTRCPSQMLGVVQARSLLGLYLQPCRTDLVGKVCGEKRYLGDPWIV